MLAITIASKANAFSRVCSSHTWAPPAHVCQHARVCRGDVGDDAISTLAAPTGSGLARQLCLGPHRPHGSDQRSAPDTSGAAAAATSAAGAAARKDLLLCMTKSDEVSAQWGSMCNEAEAQAVMHVSCWTEGAERRRGGGEGGRVS